jgi:DNA-binding transcriptional regulator YhcF (GntR family)
MRTSTEVVTVTAPYLQIAEDIRARIARGELSPGDAVPSARQITREWGVAIATATKALATLRQAGLVRAVPGVGTLVADRRPPARKPVAAAKIPRAPARAAEAPGRDLAAGRIVRAAIELADADGLAALSMRRVAAALGVATMSLYRHVPTKEELVVLMADAAFAELPPPARRVGDWRAQLDQCARLQWQTYRRHRWLAQVISMTRPQALPNGMAYTEWVLGALDRFGLDSTTMLHAAVNLFAYVRGVALSLEDQARDEQDSGLTDEEWMETQDGEIARVAAGRYPHLVDLAANPVDMDLESLFDFGLHRLLDGYAVMIGAVMIDVS